MAKLIRSISIPRPKTSVATQILLLKSLNSLYLLILCGVRNGSYKNKDSWGRPPGKERQIEASKDETYRSSCETPE